MFLIASGEYFPSIKKIDMGNPSFLFYVFRSHPLRIDKAVRAGAVLKKNELRSSVGQIVL
jgi:hypothetical protein